MKHRFKFIAVLGAALVASLCIPPVAEAQVTPTSIGTATNIAATVASGALSNQTSRIPVWQGKGLTLEYAFNVSSGTSNVVLQVYPVPDGTNAWTVATYSLTSTARGTTAVTNGLVLTPDQLRGIRQIQIGFTNQNAGTLTNYYVKWSIPY